MINKIESNLSPGDLQLAMPTVVSSVLQRQYLVNNDDVLTNSLQLRTDDLSHLELPVMIRIKSLGTPKDDNWKQVIISIQRALTGCYLPGIFQLCFLVESDGRHLNIYFGLRSYSLRKYPEEYLENFASVLTSECPGTKFEFVPAGTKSVHARRLCMPVTGIPTESSFGVASIESLINTMQGKEFSFLVLADPMPLNDIERALYACREMQSVADTLKNISMSRGETWSKQFSQQISKTYQETQSVSDSTSEKGKIGAAVTAGATIAVAALVAPEIAPLILMGGGLLLPTNTSGTSYSTTEGRTTTHGLSLTEGGSTSTTLNVVNAHLVEVSNYLKKFSDRLAEGKLYGTWNTSVYFLANKKSVIDQGSILLKALYTGETSYLEPIRTHDHLCGIENESQEINGAIRKLFHPGWDMYMPHTHNKVTHPLGEAFSSLSTPLTSCELARWLNLPHKDVPGFSIVPYADGFAVDCLRNDSDLINIGNNLASNNPSATYSIPVDALTRHTLLTGMTRQGKSNTCKHILNELRMLKDQKIPFLVIEPAKTEYIDWAIEKNKKNPGSINIFMPGRVEYRQEELRPLKINPFEVIWENAKDELRIAEHIQHLTTIINASLPMQESLPLLMEEAIYACYAEETFPKVANNPKSGVCQWICTAQYDITEPAPWGSPFPTFKTLLKYAKIAVERKKYSAQSNASLMAALDTRIGSFLHKGLAKCECFLTDGIPNPSFWKELFAKPTVINLSAVGDDNEKAFFMAILLMFLYEYRSYQNTDLGYSDSLRHLLVLEEAHCILQRTQNAGMDSIDTVGKVSNMFSNMISEIGAYGQGIMIIDQSPEKLSTDAIKNTNLKIVHRLTYGADKSQMGTALDLSPAQEKIISTLGRGEAIIRSDDDEKPSIVKVKLAQS